MFRLYNLISDVLKFFLFKVRIIDFVSDFTIYYLRKSPLGIYLYSGITW